MKDHRNKSKFSEKDILKISTVGDIAFSPDQNFLLYTITEAADNDWQSYIEIIDLETSTSNRISTGTSPKWSPDGKAIAFEDTFDGYPAIFVYDIGNQSKQHLINRFDPDYFVDHFALNNFCWSPDGLSIAYVSALPVDESESFVREFDHLLYKSKGGRGRNAYAAAKESQVWLVNVSNKKKRLFLNSGFYDHSLSFSPDGKRLCFVSNRSGAPDLNQWSRIFTAELATGRVTRVSSEEGSAFLPTWSPDGKYIAYLGINSKLSTNDSPAEDTQLFVIPATGGDAIDLTRSLDRRVEQPAWLPSSAGLLFTAGDKGHTNVYEVIMEPGQLRKVTNKKGKISEYSLSDNGKKLAFVFTSSSRPAELFFMDLITAKERQLTQANQLWSETKLIQEPEGFWFKSYDDTPVQGWIVKPATFNDREKYPLILVIHGGPHNMFGSEFEDRMQLLSAKGYGILFVNPRGSSGYGQAFSNGCVNAWGEGDYEDLMKGVDTAIENNPWIDRSRLGVTGQSYGGYMTNRIITKTNRFSAAVADGSICNLVSFAGTSLFHSLMESEFQRPVNENFDALWSCSPLKDVRKVNTPLLLLHGETDQEVPFSQAEEMFTAVRKTGTQTRLVQYRGEGHGWRPDLRPMTKIDLLNRMVAWFDKFLQNPDNDHKKGKLST